MVTISADVTQRFITALEDHLAGDFSIDRLEITRLAKWLSEQGLTPLDAARLHLTALEHVSANLPSQDSAHLSVETTRWLTALLAAMRGETDDITGLSARDLLDHTPDGFFLASLDGIIYRHLTSACLDILGYTPEELAGINLFDKVYPYDLEMAQRGIRRLASNPGERITARLRLLNKNGEPRWVAGVLSHLAGRPPEQALLVQYHDISDVYQKTADLIEAETRYRTIVETAQEGIWLLDERGCTVFANQSMQDMLGYTLEEMMGRPLQAFIDPNAREAVMAFTRTMILGTPGRVDLLMQRKDGSRLCVLLSASRRVDSQGRTTGALALVSDITAHRQAEEALRTANESLEAHVSARTLDLEQANHQLQDYLDSANDLIQSTTPEGRFLFVNRAWREALGYTAEEVQNLTVNDILLPLHYTQFEDMQNGALRGTTRLLKQEEMVFITRGGQELLVEGKVNARRESDGQMTVRGYFRDVTQRKRFEEELENQRNELRMVNAELARAARLKDEFLASMSHELRTPLTGVLAHAEVMQDPAYGPLNEKQQKSLKAIHDSGKHLLDLINDILDLSKIEAGKLELVLETVSSESICRSSLQLVKQIASKKQQTVVFDPYPEELLLQADPRRLKQMLVNLLYNAVKFTPAGGSLGLRVLPDPAGSQMRFQVWDTGIGIAPSDMRRLFQPFVQLDSSLAREHAGSGMGLVLVQRMARLHNGSVSVESTVGQGSCFTITLPWNAPEQRREKRPIGSGPLRSPLPTAPLNPDRGLTIMVVDDNDMNRDLFCELLARSYQVVPASSGEEALEIAARHLPDLVVMDVQMPGMDGLETTRRLRANPRTAAIPVVALTAYAMQGDRERCLAAGMNEYLSKPVDMRQLVHVIRDLLNRPEANPAQD